LQKVRCTLADGLIALVGRDSVPARRRAAATRTAVVNAMDGDMLGKAVLVARFHRP